MASADWEIKTVRFACVRESAGGGSRIRTGDILLAKQTLYQLSYTPRGEWKTENGKCKIRRSPPQNILHFALYILHSDVGGPDKSRTCDLVLIRDAL